MICKNRVIHCFFLLLLFGTQLSIAREEKVATLSINVQNKASLQRGAKLFMNYCSGCHSLKYLRYNRMAVDLGLMTHDGQLDEGLLKNNLIFTQATIYDPIEVAIPPEDAKQWFGIVPPDLSLTARDRGALWLYTYLKSFYSDNLQAFGTNNLLFPEVAMPNILEPLIGKTVLMHNKGDDKPYLQLIGQGEMSPAQLNEALNDLVTFLVYVGEPGQLIRYQLGICVIAFLFALFFVAYWLQRIYWRRIK